MDWLCSILTGYLALLQQYGLAGVCVLMALEGSILPVIPAEFVVPPAVYLESTKNTSAWQAAILVIAASTLGSYLGASGLYWVSRGVGRRLVVRYGKYLFLSEARLMQAELWMHRYGAKGILIARLLPTIRHASAFIAGLAGMRFLPFSAMTLCGSAIWCTVLTVFGLLMAPEIEVLIRTNGSETPARYQHAVATLSVLVMAFVIVTGSVSYVIMRKAAPARARPGHRGDENQE